ncbi:MAG: hypothetical protein M1820_008264 [Bogoriella megaspora]|nr:MAG: hypothetical protein M1820_008264 [Bogoriella megaspora]
MASPTQRPVDEVESSLSSASLRPEFPFPDQDRTRRSSSAQRYRPRRGSTASSMSIGSIGAISTLLQPPIVRTGLAPYPSALVSSSQKQPTSKDIPPVTLTNIPDIDTSTFTSYLSQVGPLFQAFQRSKSEPDSATTILKKNDTDKSDEFVDLLEKGLRQSTQPSAGPSRQNSLAPTPSSESPQPRRRSSGGPRRSPLTVAPLSTVPNVYFDDSFHLENPRTFDIVSERSEVIRQPEKSGANGSVTAGRKVLATNAILQEKLSWYMDTVEVHLIAAISTASTSFFAALGSLRELQQEAADSVVKIQDLRSDLNRLDREMALGGLKVIAMRQKRENLRKLGQATRQLQQVVDDVAIAEEMVEEGKWDIALAQIKGTEKLMAGGIDPEDDAPRQPSGPSSLLDLRGMKALDTVKRALDHLRYRAGKGFETRFLDALLKDLRSHVESVPHSDTLRRWAAASQRTRGEPQKPPPMPNFMRPNEQLRVDLKAALDGLARSKQTAAATSALRDAVMREIKALIRKHLPSSSDDDAESITSTSTRGGRHLSQAEKSSILARNLRALDDEAAEEMLVKMYTAVSEALRRLGIQIKVLLDVTSDISSPPPTAPLKSPLKSPNLARVDHQLIDPSSPISRRKLLQDELTQALDLSNLLGQAVDVAQAQITKVLKVRAEQNVRLPLERFLRYFTINKLFADECEAISGRSGAALKGVINQQIDNFIHLFADAQKQKIAQALESDRWDAVDFGEAEELILGRVLQGMSSDPPAWTKGRAVWEGIADTNANGTVQSRGETNGNGKDKIRSATVDEQKYLLVESIKTLLQGLQQFQIFIACVPGVTSDLAAALLDYLKLFNSRTTQLILGAGATRSAGLKNITTKHLALASQALSFIIALMPYIREFVRRHSPSTGVPILPEFDKVKRSLQDHQSGIHDKLIEIMSGRASFHIKKGMQLINFDEAGRLNTDEASPYMDTLTKDTNTLYKVLKRHLPETSVQMIMIPVFESYRTQWSEAFRDVRVTTLVGKERLLRDAELFESKLNKIEGFDDTGTRVIEIVKAKPIAEETDDSRGNESAQTT